MSMITIETIVSELNSAPEPLLAEVLGFIRAAKSKVVNESNQTETLEISQKIDQANRDRSITKLLESFQTDDVTLEMIDAEVEDVRAELYARQKSL
jgi:ABC-type uncharacterized transport system ATPase subunit